MLSRDTKVVGPDRYGHIFQLDGEKQCRNKAEGIEEISRKEAAHRVLGIMKKLGLPWQRKPQPLLGYRSSL
jgi:hypothetical protein